MKQTCLALSLLSLAACSATTLRCGIDDDQSYVELINIPQDITGQARHFTNLCGFAYTLEEPVKLNIIGEPK